MCDLNQPDDPEKPMSTRLTYSMYACADSDLSKRDLIPGEPRPASASRSQLGYLIWFMGGVIESVSRRQPSVAIDTAAAELFAASTCAQAILCISDVLMFISFGVLGVDATPLWIDNEACILIAKDATSIKRLAYMARRAAWMRELTDTNHDVRQVVRPLKVDGTANPADALTKYLSKPIFRAYAARMYNCSEEGL
jgi:hypothetical protein